MDIKSAISPNVTTARENKGDSISAANSSTQTGANNTSSAVNSSTKVSISQLSRQMMNNTILAAQEEVSIAAGDKSMALLYRAAIEAINEELAPTLGENSVQKSVDSGVDYSPEATADRIVSFATKFFSTHQQQNKSMGLDEQVDSFMLKIGGAIDQGFKEASDILSGLKVLEGDIAAGVDKTYELIQQGLAQFRQDKLPKDESQSVTQAT
ncbi:DUF5610 domain-containing protein [Shewanella livingstonensis]|uniref:DUF5610 domain-containing protein n=1 Tax=Shewanella livingstonensis TaxID=150120 RepID=A0A3G8LXW9_9GAMM|nr:DUF5610 domain-containing protein [Shewanella livingstonensis]AZG74546.1 hypothetical protein EGC82_18430 [Shewanella livingstonensis]